MLRVSFKKVNNVYTNSQSVSGSLVCGKEINNKSFVLANSTYLSIGGQDEYYLLY